MKTIDITNTLGKVVFDAKIAPIQVPNESLETTEIFLDIAVVRGRTTDQTLNGEAPSRSGYVQISVVAKKRMLEDEALEIADKVAALFWMGQNLPVGDAFIEIPKHPDILQGYPTGSAWIVPVRIDYRV